jgi:hypothetical protein
VPIAEATPGANKFAVDTASTLQCTFGPGLPNNRLVIRKTPIAIIVSPTVAFAQQHCQCCLQLCAVGLNTAACWAANLATHFHCKSCRQHHDRCLPDSFNRVCMRRSSTVPAMPQS